MSKITRAILSVTDKTGIVELGQCLAKFNVEILSTGGTAKVLQEAGVAVTEVSDFTGFPEVMDGRLKTLHPKIEGGILGIRNNPNHQKAMQELDIKPIDMVVVNLYEFEKTVAKPGVTLEEAIENIDIGGPTMIRAAAKNYQDVAVVVDPADYICLQEELEKNQGSISLATQKQLAVKVFQKTAQYEKAINEYLSRQSPVAGGQLTADSTDDQIFPENLSLQFNKIQNLRYGENPHQQAAYYQESGSLPGSLVQARQLHGKELSFNNIIDLQAALGLAQEFKDPACVIVKHTNPCGTALGKTLEEAFIKAKEGDPVSSFGGIIGVNQKVDAATAKAMAETFFECIIAPGFEEAALEILQAKKNIRLMVLDPFYPQSNQPQLDVKRISGGLLLQDADQLQVAVKECQIASERKPTDDELAELDFAWKIVKHVKSNAIVFTKNRQLLGVGAGQMSRVDSVKIAVSKSRQSLEGAVIASDAFFPFRDGVDEAAKEKISAVIQPGGSVRDEEVIQCANENNLAMVFTGKRHFRH